MIYLFHRNSEVRTCRALRLRFNRYDGCGVLVYGTMIDEAYQRDIYRQEVYQFA